VIQKGGIEGQGHGLPLHVEVEGEGDLDVVLIHGFGASRFTWRFWQPELRSRFRLHLIDLKGFGAAPKPNDDNYSPRDHSDLIVRYVQYANLKNYVLVGHSMGGGLALMTHMALEDSGGRLPIGLILVAAAAYPQKMPSLIGLARNPILGPALFASVPARLMIKMGLKAAYHPDRPPTSETIDGYVEGLSSPGAKEALRKTAINLVPPNLEAFTSRLPLIRTPTLLIWGKQDHVVPYWVGERLHRELENSELVSLDECGHVPPEEMAPESLEPVLRFLATQSEQLRATPSI